MLDDDYEPLANRIADADRRWLAAIDHGLALRPEDRPQTVPAWTTAMRGARAAPVSDVDAEARLSRRDGFSEEQYQAAKPYFQAAWREAQKAAWEFGYFVRELAKFLMVEHDLDLDTAFDVVGRFAKEQVAD